MRIISIQVAFNALRMRQNATQREEKGTETVAWDKPMCKEEERTVKSTKKEWIVR